MIFAIQVGYKGEGYSKRLVGIEAETSEEAHEKAVAWYAKQIVATDLTAIADCSPKEEE